MEAIVLVGGKGTRLRSVVSDVPKPMAPVKDKPFLEYLLNELIDQGISKVVLAVGYKAEIIIEYFGNRYKNIEIEYSIEENSLGTGGAIKKALELDKKECFDYIIVSTVDLIAFLPYFSPYFTFFTSYQIYLTVLFLVYHLKVQIGLIM